MGRQVCAVVGRTILLWLYIASNLSILFTDKGLISYTHIIKYGCMCAATNFFLLFYTTIFLFSVNVCVIFPKRLNKTMTLEGYVNSNNELFLFPPIQSGKYFIQVVLLYLWDGCKEYLMVLPETLWTGNLLLSTCALGGDMEMRGRGELRRGLCSLMLQKWK